MHRDDQAGSSPTDGFIFCTVVRSMKRRWKVLCSYDGTEFSGWQSQVNGRSIQDVIEHRLEAILKQPTRITASGRTDAGVHARGQVFHFDAEWNNEEDDMLRAMRAGLPSSIGIQKVKAVSNDFHSRFSAVGKQYCYRFYLGYAPPHLTRYRVSTENRNMDLSRLTESVKLYEGWHDFRSFAANRGEPYEDTFRYIANTEVRRSGNLLSIHVEGNGFLYKMVRAMVGVLMEVSLGKMNAEDIRELLNGREREHFVVTAPAQGLTLEKVFYKDRGYPDR